LSEGGRFYAVNVTDDIAGRRLLSHGLAGAPFTSIAAVVEWLGAVQSQEYAVAKWSVGQRATGISDAAMDRALADATILRTHVLRPTWHFVAAADLRWLLALSAPRVHALNAYYYRKLGLDGGVFAKSNALLARALSGGNQLTRKELAAVLAAGGVDAAALRLGYLLMYAELEAVIVSGGLAGKQRTYALFDDRVPAPLAGDGLQATERLRRPGGAGHGVAEPWDRDRALAELTRRYFTSHGPATRADFQWWSSLTAADAKRGLAFAAADLEELEVDGQTYWCAARPAQGRPDPSPTVHLLQGYDEYLVAYTGRPRALDSAGLARTTPYGRPPFLHAIILDGMYVGSWQRTLTAGQVSVQVRLARRLDPAEHAALADAVDRYGRFVDLPAMLTVDGEARG
jgi:Winged helix DNA-binding domain